MDMLCQNFYSITARNIIFKFDPGFTIFHSCSRGSSEQFYSQLEISRFPECALSYHEQRSWGRHIVIVSCITFMYTINFADYFHVIYVHCTELTVLCRYFAQFQFRICKPACIHCTVFKPLPTCTLHSMNSHIQMYTVHLQLLQCTQPKSVQSASFPQIVQCLLHPSCPNCTVYSVHFFNDYVYRTRTKKGCITLFSQFIFKLSVTPQYKICS